MFRFVTGGETPGRPIGEAEVGELLTRSGLDVVVGRAMGTVLVTVRGPLRAEGARDLVASVDDVLDDRPERVVIDLTGVTTIDDAGVAVLERAQERADAHDVQLQVTSRSTEILSRLGGAPFEVV